MKKWEEFELQCTNFLNERFGAYAQFLHQGGADSTVADILVNINNGKSFYIDVKSSPAQCGQFVLIPNMETKTFEYSYLNANRVNKYTNMIIDYMNNDFNGFREAGTAGKSIDMPNGSYKDKGTKFFITNNYTILPVENFSEYFKISAKYRIKKSGSGNVGKRQLDIVTDYIKSHNYIITQTYNVGDKLFVISPEQLNKNCFSLRGIDYMFSLRGDKYEIRKLSNTCNANVIFSIKLKSLKLGMSESEFIDYLK